MFLRNVSWRLVDIAALYSRGLKSLEDFNLNYVPLFDSIIRVIPSLMCFVTDVHVLIHHSHVTMIFETLWIMKLASIFQWHNTLYRFVTSGPYDFRFRLRPHIKILMFETLLPSKNVPPPPKPTCIQFSFLMKPCECLAPPLFGALLLSASHYQSNVMISACCVLSVHVTQIGSADGSGRIRRDPLRYGLLGRSSCRTWSINSQHFRFSLGGPEMYSRSRYTCFCGVSCSL
jgi:hypothetical protein